MHISRREIGKREIRYREISRGKWAFSRNYPEFNQFGSVTLDTFLLGKSYMFYLVLSSFTTFLKNSEFFQKRSFIG